MTALLLPLAYLVGALPLGYWLARRRGVDLRTASPYTLGLESALRRLGLGLLLLSFWGGVWGWTSPASSPWGWRSTWATSTPSSSGTPGP